MHALCGAKRRDGNPCKLPSVTGAVRCRMHGGAAGAGRPITHGRYSRYTQEFGEVWERVRADADLLHFEDDIALFSLRQRELAARVGQEDSPAFRERALELAAEAERAITERDASRLDSSLKALVAHIRLGDARDDAWRELEANAERRVALVQKALDALHREREVMSAQQFVGLLGQMVEIVRKELGEQDAFRVAQRFERDIVGRLGEGAAIAALPPAAEG